MKKKILIISIIASIVLIIISVFIFYKVQDGKKALEVSVNDINNTKEEILEETEENKEFIEETKEKIEQNTEENNIESTKENSNKNTQENNIKNTNEIPRQETQKNNKIEETNDKKQESPQIQPVQKVESTKEEPKKEEQKKEESKKEEVKIDLSKYDRYEKVLNGGYKAYKKSDSEMAKLKELINASIKDFGYTNVKVVASNSVPQNTQYFTANKTNVENKVYNSEDFTICYYAETEYHISENGTETIFQCRSYIKIQ